jgi:rod shape-determining protein MreC
MDSCSCGVTVVSTRRRSSVPIGKVTEVYSSLRESSRRAVVEPFVNFSALDVVGVVVPTGSTSDRAVVEADGSLR